MSSTDGATRPDYDGACITQMIRAIQAREPWVPEAVTDASSVVLLVIDGLGANELDRRRADLPTLASLQGRPITTVVPSTTPTALSSISLWIPPAEHGVVGYRILLGEDVFNVLRWSGAHKPDPATFQPREAFGTQPLPVVSRAQFRNTPFTSILYRGAPFHGWFTTATMVEMCARLVDAGERFVYAYYDGVDLVAHMHGLRDAYIARELTFCDRLAADMLDALPPDAALVVTADHGHVHFDERIELGAMQELVRAQSGESRFRYLHARSGAQAELEQAARELCGDDAWCMTRDELIEDGWLGPRPPSPEVRRRIGDVVLAARGPIGFVDPANPGESRLLSGHGSLTADEMLVPLVGARGRRTSPPL